MAYLNNGADDKLAVINSNTETMVYYIFLLQWMRRGRLIFKRLFSSNTIAAKESLKKLIRSNPSCDISAINTHKNPAYGQAIKRFEIMRMFSSIFECMEHVYKYHLLMSNLVFTSELHSKCRIL